MAGAFYWKLAQIVSTVSMSVRRWLYVPDMLCDRMSATVEMNPWYADVGVRRVRVGT